MEKEAATCEHTFKQGRRKGTACGAKAIPFSFGWPFCRTHAPWHKKVKEIVENREIMADFGLEEDFWNEEEDIEEWVKEMSKLPEKPDPDPWAESEESPTRKEEEPEKPSSGKRVSSKRRRARDQAEAKAEAKVRAGMRLDPERENRYVERLWFEEGGTETPEPPGVDTRWLNGEMITQEAAYNEKKRIGSEGWSKITDGWVVEGRAGPPPEVGTEKRRVYDRYLEHMQDMSRSYVGLEVYKDELKRDLTELDSGDPEEFHREFHRLRKRIVDLIPIYDMILGERTEEHRGLYERFRVARKRNREVRHYDPGGLLELCPYGECKCEK